MIPLRIEIKTNWMPIARVLNLVATFSLRNTSVYLQAWKDMVKKHVLMQN